MIVVRMRMTRTTISKTMLVILRMMLSSPCDRSVWRCSPYCGNDDDDITMQPLYVATMWLPCE